MEKYRINPADTQRIKKEISMKNTCTRKKRFASNNSLFIQCINMTTELININSYKGISMSSRITNSNTKYHLPLGMLAFIKPKSLFFHPVSDFIVKVLVAIFGALMSC